MAVLETGLSPRPMQLDSHLEQVLVVSRQSSISFMNHCSLRKVHSPYASSCANIENTMRIFQRGEMEFVPKNEKVDVMMLAMTES